MRSKKICNIRLFFLACICLLCNIYVNGCVIQNDGSKEEKIKVRVGYFPNLTHLQAVIGLSDNTFQNYLGNNIIIKKKTFNAGPDEMQAFMANELDIGYIGPVPAINGYSKTNGKIKIVTGSCNNGAVLLVRSDLPINSVSDLKGKKIAVPQFANTQDILLRKIMSDNNLKSVDNGGDITVIQSENANIAVLLDRKQIDAAFVPEPWATTIIKKSNARVLLNSNEIFGGNDYSTTVIIVNSDFAKKHSDIVQKWVEANKEITEKISTNKQLYAGKFIDEISKLTGVKLQNDIIEQSMNNIHLSSDIPVDSLQNYIDYLYNFKYINKRYDSSKVIDSSYGKK